MAKEESKNKNLMKAIRALHSRVGADDIEKHRQSQKNIGNLLKVIKGVEYEELKIGEIQAEWVQASRKHDNRHIILYCHGGGYFTGNLQYARTITAKLTTTTSMDVLSFNYRLAPEFPFPAALEDALAVWDYLMHFGYGANDVVVAGDSAGGNLALALVHKLRKQGRRQPKGLVLLSPWADLTCSGQSYETRKEIDPILDKEYIASAIEAYAKGKNLKHPLISPLFGNFHNFPPVYIQVGDNEILLDDARQLYEKIIEPGNYCRLDQFPGMWHVFQMSPFKSAYDAMDLIADFIYDIYR